MAVYTATQRAQGIVKMHATQVTEAHDAVEGSKGSVARLTGAQVVARSKGVARVEAHSNTALILHTVDDVGEVLEAVAKV